MERRCLDETAETIDYHYFTTWMQGVAHAFYNSNSKLMSDKTSEYVCSGCNQSVSKATNYRHKIPGVCVSRMTGTATSNLQMSRSMIPSSSAKIQSLNEMRSHRYRQMK